MGRRRGDGAGRCVCLSVVCVCVSVESVCLCVGLSVCRYLQKNLPQVPYHLLWLSSFAHEFPNIYALNNGLHPQQKVTEIFAKKRHK